MVIAKMTELIKVKLGWSPMLGKVDKTVREFIKVSDA